MNFRVSTEVIVLWRWFISSWGKSPWWLTGYTPSKRLSGINESPKSCHHSSNLCTSKVRGADGFAFHWWTSVCIMSPTSLNSCNLILSGSFVNSAPLLPVYLLAVAKATTFMWTQRGKPEFADATQIADARASESRYWRDTLGMLSSLHSTWPRAAAYVRNSIDFVSVWLLNAGLSGRFLEFRLAGWLDPFRWPCSTLRVREKPLWLWTRWSS